MYIAAFELSSMDHLSDERQRNILLAGVDFLAYVNTQFLRAHPTAPKLYACNPQYIIKRRPMGIDGFSDIPTVIGRGAGDCKDFVAWRLAEYIIEGVHQAQPFITKKRIHDIDCWHVMLQIGRREEDPSALLGMPAGIPYEELREAFR